MAGGGKVMIASGDDIRLLALVRNGRLLVDTGTSGGGPTADVNIASVGGVLVTSPLPVLASQGTNPWVVSGTVLVGNFPASIGVTQVTTPWVVSGAVTVTGTVDIGTVAGTVTVTGTVSSTATGLVSVGNSTTTTLLAGATFTGTFENVKDYAAVTVTVFSTQASAADGMKLQWSHNGINVDQENSVTVQANTGRAFSIPVEGLFFRIVYTNGGVGQVTFRLGIVYKPTAAGLNAVSIDQDINASGAIVVGTRSLITGETTAGGGAFVNVKVTPSGALVADVTGTVNIGNTPLLVDQNLPPWSVTVSSQTPGTGATNLGKAEDLAHTSGDVGVMALAVRQDVQTPLAGNGDYIPLTTDSAGSLRVGGTVGVNGVIPGVAATSLGKAEDAVHASGDTGVATWAVRQDTAAALAANGDYIPFTTDALGNLRVGGASTSGLGKVEDAAHASGDVGVMALAVRADAGAPLAADGDYIPLVTDNVGSLKVTVQGIIPSNGATNLGKAEDAAHTTGDVGVFALIVRSDTGVSTATTDGDYTAPIADSTGNLWTTVRTIVPGTGATQLGKAEDAAHSSGDVGVMALGVRQDTPAALGANGDYTPPSFDSAGHLWVRTRGDFVSTIAFSASTRGRPVQIMATATAGTLIHTATTTTGQIDKMYLDLTNTSTASVTVTIEFGTSGVANNISVVVPAKETVKVLEGVVIGGAATDEVRAFASTASVVNAVGRVERLTT